MTDFDVEEDVSLAEPFDLQSFAGAMTQFHGLVANGGEQVSLAYLIAAFTASVIFQADSARYPALFRSKGIDVGPFEVAVRKMLAELETKPD